MEQGSGVPPAPGDLSWALHQLAVAGAEVDVALADSLSLGLSDYLAMKHLLTAAVPMGPVELGRLLGMSSGSATGLVDRLQRAGHVERRPHPDDRRRLVVQPTAAATRRILDALAPLGEALDRLGGGFTPAERTVIQRFLTGALDCHRGVRRPG